MCSQQKTTAVSNATRLTDSGRTFSAACYHATAPTVLPDRARYLQRMSDSDGDDEKGSVE